MSENKKLTASSDLQADVSDTSLGNSQQSNVSSEPGVPSGATAVAPEMKNVQDLTRYVELLLQQMQDRFQAISDQVLTRIDDMGNRIDDLEKNIADLITQSGVEGPPK